MILLLLVKPIAFENSVGNYSYLDGRIHSLHICWFSMSQALYKSSYHVSSTSSQRCRVYARIKAVFLELF